MTQLLEAGLLWVKPGMRVWMRRPNQHPSLPFTDPRPGQAILRPYQGYCRVLRNSFHELDCSEIPECPRPLSIPLSTKVTILYETATASARHCLCHLSCLFFSTALTISRFVWLLIYSRADT